MVFVSLKNSISREFSISIIGIENVFLIKMIEMGTLVALVAYKDEKEQFTEVCEDRILIFGRLFMVGSDRDMILFELEDIVNGRSNVRSFLHDFKLWFDNRYSKLSVKRRYKLSYMNFLDWLKKYNNYLIGFVLL